MSAIQAATAALILGGEKDAPLWLVLVFLGIFIGFFIMILVDIRRRSGRNQIDGSPPAAGKANYMGKQ